VVKLIIQLPKLIRKYIKDKGITQKEFSKLTGINEASVSRLMKSDQTQIDIRTLKKLYGTIPLDFGNLILVEEEASDDNN
jgi:transcriptional regulator with XRE-family HTH domain